MEFKIEDRTIFITLHGSYAYGMATDSSDIDIKGVAIPPKEYFLGFHKRFEQFQGQFPKDYLTGESTFIDALEKRVGRKIPKEEKIDSVIFGLHKFIGLATDCNPNIIEILFTDEKDHIVTSATWEILKENRDLFLSTKARFTFCGYAFSQLKRIRTHRGWILNPLEVKPERKDFGLPDHGIISVDHREAAEGLIKKKVEEWILLPDELPREVLESVRANTVSALKEIWAGMAASYYYKDGMEYKQIVPPLEFDELDINELNNAAGRILGYSTNFLEYLDRERKYKGALRYYKQYQEWKKTRNPIRAELEAKFHYDCKHASHLVRLLRMSKEILQEGKVIVKRPDAEELLAIRNGAWSYDQLIEWAEKQQADLEEFYNSGKSPLPKKPNINEIDKLCIEITQSYL